MSLFQSSFGRPYYTSLSLGQFGLALLLAMAGVATGWILEFWLGFGITGAYLPLLVGVAAVTWVGGLWPSLFSQVLGATLTLFLGTHAFAVVLRADLYAVLLFLLAAKLIMFLLLSIQVNRHLRQNRTHLEMIVQSTHDSLWEWDLGANHVWRGGRVAESFGYASGEVEHSLDWWLKRIHPAEAEDVWAGLRRAVDGVDNQWSSEYRLRRKDGSYAVVSDHGFIVRNKKGAALRMFGGMTDVSAQRTAEEHLTCGASRDALTGLLNRESLLSQLHRLLEKRRYRNDGPIAVLFIDIDRFKIINEHFGHGTGNQILSIIATRLIRCLREKDIAARFGNDEFVVLLERVERPAEAIHVAQRIQQALSAPFKVNGQTAEATASIGISFAESTPAEEAVQQADLAMCRAKSQGPARFQVFEPAFQARTRHALRYQSELRRSFHDGSLQLYYQPIISLQNGCLFGFEALLRWQHPKQGLVRPFEILSLAEETGLSVPLGQWVLRNCCLCLGRWKQSSLVPASLLMSFNLSAKELMRPTLVTEVRELLSNTHLDGTSLQIELHETTIMQSDAIAAKKLEDLRNLGVCIAIDDFGRGQSSLGRLQDLPISTIKIDGLFIRQAGIDKPQMLDAMIELAHKLKLQVIAEGVETSSQLRCLEGRGSTLAQGFLFSKPMTEENAFQLLKSQHSWNIAAIAKTAEAYVSRET